MVIYGEYLFLENFITGLIITYFTGKFAGEEMRWYRILLCGICCGAFAFTLFWPKGSFPEFLSEAVFAAVMAVLAFGRRSRRQVLRNTALFILVTILCGGTAMAFVSIFSRPAVWGGGAIYMSGTSYLTVTLAALAALAGLQLAVTLLRERRRSARSVVKVSVSMGGRCFDLSGFIDSGCFLKEPLTGKPVALVGKELMGEMLSGVENAAARYTVVPYRTVGVEKGMLEAWRADYAEIEGRRFRRPVLAVCRDGLFLPDEGSRQILLPAEFLERGNSW
ncbi:MAG: sigma-E processing peptidase SpoIIGA [Emergencia sp.]